ncbi:MAG: MFS transporter [Chloroflexi bacterium]|nr:MFS transporter [Chloroflexota bacterium]
MSSLNSPLPVKQLFRLYFFLIFAALGMIITYMPLHYDSIGFSGIEISTIMIGGSAAVILIAPKYGLIFDQAANKRSVLITSLLIMAFTLGTIGWLKLFVPVLLLWMIYRSVQGPFYATSENLSYSVASSSKEHQGSSFGSIRLWGSIGYGVSTLFAGWIYQNYGFTYNSVGFLILIGLSIVVLLFLPGSVFDMTGGIKRLDINLSSVLKMVSSHRFLWLMALALAISDPTQDGIRSFEPIYMQNLGLQAGIIGLANSLSALGELPFMLNADKVIRKIGIQRIIIFVFLFDLLRRLVVWFFPSAGVVFVTSVLTSASFTFRLVSSITLVNLILPKHVTSTANALIGVTMFGVGYMISNALSGFVYDRFGNREVYLVGAALCLVSLCLALGAGKAPDNFSRIEPGEDRT